MTAVIETLGGRLVDVLDPRPEDIDILDIATALGNLCRFNGQVQKFYSVAEHSVIMSDNMPPEFAIYGLLHDAAEAYVSDIVRPLKATLKGYDEIEDRMLMVIFEALGVSWAKLGWCPAVEKADLSILAMEKQHVMKSEADWAHLKGIEPMADEPRFWVPESASGVFLAQYQGLKR